MPANQPPPAHTTQLQGDLPAPLTHNETQQQYTTALGYIKLPMYQLFLWRLYIMVLRGATSLLGALEGVGPESSTFLGQNGTRFARAISGPKKVLIFRAHSFQCPS